MAKICFKCGLLAVLKRYGQNNPDKRAAQTEVSNAIRSGRLKKEACEVCNITGNVEAHHPDYSKPLDVKWLCVRHHNDEHIKIREEQLRRKVC